MEEITQPPHQGTGVLTFKKSLEKMTRDYRDLFTGTAWYYARFRPQYPKEVFDLLISKFHLDGTGRLLDIGCGTGQVILPLAKYFTEVVGLDSDPEMLKEAENAAANEERGEIEMFLVCK